MPSNSGYPNDHDLLIELISAVKANTKETEVFLAGHVALCEKVEQIEKNMIRGEGRFTAIETKQRGFCETIAKQQQMVADALAKPTNNPRGWISWAERIGLWATVVSLILAESWHVFG